MTPEDLEKLTAWRKTGKYLPRQWRDFHDQKDLFKTIEEMYPNKAGALLGDVNWIDGQIYVIDKFLWFMAMCGYTLQRNRSDLPFADYDEINEERQEEMRRQWAAQAALKENSGE